MPKITSLTLNVTLYIQNIPASLINVLIHLEHVTQVSGLAQPRVVWSCLVRADSIFYSIIPGYYSIKLV